MTRILTLLNISQPETHFKALRLPFKCVGIPSNMCITKPWTALELDEDIANQPGTFHMLLCLQFIPSWYILCWPKNGILGCSNRCEWNGAEMRGRCIANKWFLNDLASRRYQRCYHQLAWSITLQKLCLVVQPGTVPAARKLDLNATDEVFALTK